ncbi:restriction endonuclease subunit S [Vibrio campbellii]|uniref:restriction endonuclease subunit S n=1 Tax=Vibrio campbellii TaxID=680 RepID=UPI000CD3350D|nr:restriction endonuclease subunit S [Vibrio campbellii]AUV87063.1 restriction endonuclease subunit S [Vibrio campbellii]
MTALSETKKYQAYPEYKDSGVEWLGKVPLGWKTQRLKYLCAVTTGDRDNIHKCDDGEFPFFVRSKKVERINSYSFDGEAVLTAGDGDIGKIFHYVDGKFDFHQRVYKFSDFANVSAKYFYHYLSCHLADEVVKLSAKTTVDSLRLPMLQNFVFCVPSEEEQTQIVNFLDHETAKIDTLIEKQQQLIKLLKEKRQAVISHAVTKGLNPQEPMKDSGVEWLGGVPESWQPKAIKRLFKQRKQQNNVGYEVLSVYRDFGVIQKSSRTDNHNKTPDDLSAYQLVSKGCLVINKMKAWQGSLGVSEFEGITSPDYVVYEPIHAESDKFLHFLLRRQEMPNVYRAISNGIRPSQWRIEPEKFEDLVLYLPTLEEQLEVVEAIEKEVLVYENLINKCLSATKLMEERKSALISAAVTGKIDVRNWHAPTSQNQSD